jgi:hypothetical protein
MLLAVALTGCAGDAVVYAPTPLPPDLSAQPWAHPSGAFSVAVPRHWAAFAQNEANFSSASFTPPNQPTPILTIAVIRLGSAPDPATLQALAAELQTTHRADRNRYTQTSAETTPDGVWRFGGARLNPDGSQTALNTFIGATGDLLMLVDAHLPADPNLLAEVQRAVNTVTLDPASPLPVAELSTFGFVRASALEAQNTAAWTNGTGVLFVTGEVANASGQPLENVPVRVALTDAAGNVLIEAGDVTMGYALPAGGFAPFSLRFGQGQPADAVGYRVAVGDGALFPPARTVVGAPTLEWTDDSTFAPDGSLAITGSVSNTGDQTARDLLGVVTVFDATGSVIGAWRSPLDVPTLAAGESAAYAVRLPELGGGARNYILDIQAYGE